MIGKYAGAARLRIRPLQLCDQIVAVKNIVSQDQSAGIVADEFPANDESLR